MASIEKRKSKNQWRIRWRDGTRGSKRFSGPWLKTRKEADSELAAHEAQEAARGTARALIPLPELVQRWALLQRERRQPRSQRYVDESVRALNRHIALERWRFTSDVGELDVGPGLFRLLRALLRFGRDRHAQPVHQRALVAPDRERARRPAAPLPSLEDVQHQIAEAAAWSPAAGALAHLVATYGHRPASLVRLAVGAVDRSFVGHTPADAPPEQGWLTLGVKGGRTVRHGLLPASLSILEPLLARPVAAPLFLHHYPGRDGKSRPWRSGQEWSSWYHHSVGKGRGIYRLKCYAITFMHAGGIDIPTICSITGHTTDTVARYLRSNEAMQAAALQVIGRSGVHFVDPNWTLDES